MVDTKAIPSLLISHGECRIPRNVHVDNSEKSSLELHFDYEEHSSDDSFVPSSINGESARTIGSAMKREFASRVQISKSSEVSCRKEVSYARENMKHDQIVFNAERSTDAKIILDGRCVLFHSHGRGRVWVDPPDHHDKWILLSRGRDSRYGLRLFSPGHANRYHYLILDSRIDSQSLQHSSSRRQHSFSAHRRPPQLSRERTRSPSRSRTRSPHTRTSPRGRSDQRISVIHNVKRQSRSPPILSLKEGYLDRDHNNIAVFLLKTFPIMLLYPDDILL
ncbi:hypothetical protein KSP40_PGU002346 [Platanthera guangdongensis]|uniref:Uncharacterized protein n=1 Tax=Platanthera guangdongensis TaxID=2320717 RepID=A0ABR2LZB5_9ASPA